MKSRGMALAGIVFGCIWTTSAGAQTSGPLTIPLTYYDNSQTGAGLRLGINVAIGSTVGGSPVPSLPYLFDTGSSMFNAAYYPSNWGGGVSTTTQKVEFGYRDGGGYIGTIAQVQQITLGGIALPVANLGFSINQATEHQPPSQTNPPPKPVPFTSISAPPIENVFYGTFGAGNFTATSGSYTGGSVLGQAVVPGTTAGYIVAANSYSNRWGTQNPTQGTLPHQLAGQCHACVILGLAPQLQAQFKTMSLPADGSFPVAYSGTSANSAAKYFGGNYVVTLNGTPTGTLTAGGAPGLLDTGTETFALNTANSTLVGVVSSGTTLSVTGVATGSGTLPTSVSTLGDASSGSYYATVSSRQNSSANNAYTATLGISFFMQNSVLYDLANNAMGYAPFFVTANSVVTTTAAPFSLTKENVPIGLAGVISGAGEVTVGTGAMLQLSAANTYTGATTIGAPGGSTGQLNIVGTGSIAQSSGVTNYGTFDISGASSKVSINTLAGNGQVNLGGQNLAVTNASGNFNGTISDGGVYGGSGGKLTVAGGALTLAGNNTHTGGTTVLAGAALNLAGSLGGALEVASGAVYRHLAGAVFSGTLGNAGNANVNGVMMADVINTGTLSGAGTIGNSVMNSGAIAPGNSIGTLTIGGNYVQTASGFYQAEIGSPGQNDLLKVGGRAVLQGGTVGVVATTGVPTTRTTYTILSATGGLAGTFSSVVDPYPFLQSSLSYDANNAYLTMQMGGFGQAAANPNQYAVGRVLDASVNTASGDFAQVLSAMASNTQSLALGQATLTALSGQNYSSFSSTMVQGAQFFMNNFANQTGGGSAASNRVALADACDIACDVNPMALWGAWGGALGGLGTIGANAGTGAVTYNVGGFAAGLDRLVAPGTRIGVTAGYTTGAQWTSGFAGNGTTDTFLAGLYGNYKMDKVYADAIVGYGYGYNQMWRQISIPGLQQRTAQGRTGSNQFYSQLEGGYRFDIGPLSNAVADAYVTPFVRVQGYTGAQNGFTETGAQSLNLTVAGQTTNSLRSVIGAQLGGAVDLGWHKKLAMQFRLGWSHEYASTARPVTATLAGAPLMPFTTYGIAPTRDGAVVGFAANTAVADGTSFYLRYEGNISGSDTAHALTAGVRVSW